MDAEGIEALFVERKITKNIVGATAADDKTPRAAAGSVCWALADGMLRAVAQNLIDTCPELRHLRGARILLLVRSAEADARKLESGQGRVHLGKAARASGMVRFLSGLGLASLATAEPADFVVWLSGVWLEDHGWRSGVRAPTGLGSRRAIAALMLHELCHCGARVAGTFIDEAGLDGFVQSLGLRYIETRTEIRDEEGAVLVRYYDVRDGAYVWQIRHHDVEEFYEVIERFGAWDQAMNRLVDVVHELEPLFQQAG